MLFQLGHFLNYPNFFQLYNWLVENQYKKRELLFKQQSFYLKRIVKFSYENVKFYHKKFKELNLLPEDIKSIEDLSKLPIIDKKIINIHYNEFFPNNLKNIKYIKRSTGGTTGTPFIYRVTNYERYIGGALAYRRWEHANYNLGDELLIIGGSSILPDKNTYLKQLITRIIRNAFYLDSFNLSDYYLKNEIEKIIQFRPKFIYGYPSAIEFFGKWLYNNGYSLNEIKGIVTTSETLFKPIRRNIEKYYGISVFDNYGLNDGGVSAGECKEKKGFHIDTERSILEVVDKKNKHVIGKEGEIIATSLFNYAMPFIRYRTGDAGVLSSKEDSCECKINLPILETIKGRTVDNLLTPEGNYVHGWFFLYIFWNYYKGILAYKIEQNNKDEINIYIVPEKGLNYKKTIKKIEFAVKKRVPSWGLNFIITEKITYKNKRKFIVNNILN